ncbi:hypothetical protein DYB32_010277 [Aphanomyces invadans]|uniref:Uncharacterized protein n=1 Tax=Aphanomyces invadans TaxID=157072 RepID=A0A3R6ZHB7_9STRA|nr:hypothetical protein DYB32_010277 [Aphanomyces invadans]
MRDVDPGLVGFWSQYRQEWVVKEESQAIVKIIQDAIKSASLYRVVAEQIALPRNKPLKKDVYRFVRCHLPQTTRLTMGKSMQKQLAWGGEMDLALLREVTMVETFKATDKDQRMRGTGSNEEVTEQVQLLQDLVDRRAASEETKKTKKEKEQKRRDSLESTGSQLCLEAGQRIVKRQRIANTAPIKKEDSDVVTQEILEFEKQKHADDHACRMQRLEFDKEEQKLRLAQMAESTKRNE